MRKDSEVWRGKPVKFLENKCDATDGWCSGDVAGGRVQDQLPFVDEFYGGNQREATKSDHFANHLSATVKHPSHSKKQESRALSVA